MLLQVRLKILHNIVYLFGAAVYGDAVSKPKNVSFFEQIETGHLRKY